MKGVPKRDGSGMGERANRGRGGCPPEVQKRTPRNQRLNREPDFEGRGQNGSGRGLFRRNQFGNQGG